MLEGRQLLTSHEMGAVFGWPSENTQYFQLLQSSPSNPNFRPDSVVSFGVGGGG